MKLRKTIKSIPLGNLSPLDINPSGRKNNISDLVKSINFIGLLLPLIVIPVIDKKDYYSLLDGNRRYYTLLKIYNELKANIKLYDESENPDYKEECKKEYEENINKLKTVESVDCLILEADNETDKLRFYNIINSVVKKHSGNEKLEAFINSGNKEVCTSIMYNNIYKITSVLYNDIPENKLVELKKMFITDKIVYSTFLQMWSIFAKTYDVNIKFSPTKINNSSAVVLTKHKIILNYLLLHHKYLIEIRNTYKVWSTKQILDYVSKNKLLVKEIK